MDLIRKKQKRFEEYYITQPVLLYFNELTTEINKKCYLFPQYSNPTIIYIAIKTLQSDVYIDAVGFNPTIKVIEIMIHMKDGPRSSYMFDRTYSSFNEEVTKNILRLFFITFPVEANLHECKLNILKEFLGKTTDEFIRLFYNYAYEQNKDRELIQKQLNLLN